mmetsp:Transcript_5016/g.12784  ORF Transcript_5016/g.12784 Transcript_5016/m.12784 type:complete len:323 (+) Transcript_5016:59-1027(+)
MAGRRKRRSGQVLEDVGVVLVSLQVLPRDEVFDSPLDHLHLGLEHLGQLRHHLRHELVVLEDFARLHRPHHRGVDRVPPVLVHVLQDLLLLLKGRQRHADPRHPIRELRVQLEVVLLADRLSRGVLHQQLVLGAAQRVQQPQHIFFRQVQPVSHLAVTQLLLRVKEQQASGLHGVHVQVELLREVGLDLAVPQSEDPCQPPVLGPQVVKLLEDLDALRHGPRQRELHELVGRPEARGQHVDRQVDRRLLLRVVVQVLDEPRLRVLGQLQVRHHALHLGGELGAALLLQPREHGPLVVLVRGPVEQKPLGQLLPVELGEEVLV